jgi:hypothetical protein
MVTIHAKLNFGRIGPDLEPPERSRAAQRYQQGPISMTKSIIVPGNSRLHQTLNTPMNSIVAAVKTAHDLESAHMKATRDSGVDNGARRFASDAYVIQVSGFTAGIVTREMEGCGFIFFSAAPRFSAMDGQHFSDPLAAERSARKLAEHGRLPR